MKEQLHTRNPRLRAVGNRQADHVTHHYHQKLALNSLTSGGRSVGILHLRIKSHGVYVFVNIQ
jgi:hypothetical protein